MYKEPLDIVNFLNTEHIEGYCNALAKQLSNFSNKNRDLGISPIVKNENYGFYMCDYGFMIYTLQEYIKGYYKIKKDVDTGNKITDAIYRDFALDHEENLSKKGKFFVDILSYQKLSFTNKSSKSFYTRVIIKSKDTNNHVLLNAISLNAESISNIIGKSSYESKFINGNTTNFEQIAYDKQVTTIKNYIEKSTKIYHFWDRNDGINLKLLGSDE